MTMTMMMIIITGLEPGCCVRCNFSELKKIKKIPLINCVTIIPFEDSSFRLSSFLLDDKYQMKNIT